MSRPFPLAVISDEVSQELERVVAFAKEFQLEGVEVRSLFGRAFKDLTREDARRIGETFRREGIRVAGCASPVFKCELGNASAAVEHTDIFKRSVERAVEWGCDLVRVFTFLRRSTPSTADDLKRAAGHFPKLIEAAKGSGVRIGVENEFTTLVGDGREAEAFLAALGRDGDGVGIVWDPCNVLFMTGEDRDPVGAEYERVAGRVIHLHVKDAQREKGKPPPSHCVRLGTGQVDFPGQFRQIHQRGFKGWVSLETHWREKALSAGDQHLPAGQQFSFNAEPASRICMQKLQEWLAEI